MSRLWNLFSYATTISSSSSEDASAGLQERNKMGSLLQDAFSKLLAGQASSEEPNTLKTGNSVVLDDDCKQRQQTLLLSTPLSPLKAPIIPVMLTSAGNRESAHHDSQSITASSLSPSRSTDDIVYLTDCLIHVLTDAVMHQANHALSLSATQRWNGGPLKDATANTVRTFLIEVLSALCENVESAQTVMPMIVTKAAPRVCSTPTPPAAAVNVALLSPRRSPPGGGSSHLAIPSFDGSLGAAEEDADSSFGDSTFQSKSPRQHGKSLTMFEHTKQQEQQQLEELRQQQQAIEQEEEQAPPESSRAVPLSPIIVTSTATTAVPGHRCTTAPPHAPRAPPTSTMTNNVPSPSHAHMPMHPRHPLTSGGGIGPPGGDAMASSQNGSSGGITTIVKRRPPVSIFAPRHSVVQMTPFSGQSSISSLQQSGAWPRRNSRTAGLPTASGMQTPSATPPATPPLPVSFMSSTSEGVSGGGGGGGGLTTGKKRTSQSERRETMTLMSLMMSVANSPPASPWIVEHGGFNIAMGFSGFMTSTSSTPVAANLQQQQQQQPQQQLQSIHNSSGHDIASAGSRRSASSMRALPLGITSGSLPLGITSGSLPLGITSGSYRHGVSSSAAFKGSPKLPPHMMQSTTSMAEGRVTTTNQARTRDVGSNENQYPFGDFLQDYPCFTVNQYALLDSIGKGCQGEVFSCLDMQTGLQRAIKVIPRPTQLLGTGAVGNARMNVAAARKLQQLQREVAIMKRCRHRNIIALYEVIDDQEQDELYLVMQLAQGSLLKLTSSGEATKRFDARDVIRYGQQLCSGLKYLHERGIVHRDIKPDNVLLGEDGTVLLGDFGISTFGHTEVEIATASFRRSAVTQTHNRGTPAFLAPEYLMPSSDPMMRSESSQSSVARQLPGSKPDHTFVAQCRADIWALGMTLYVMRYGKLPWPLDGDLDHFVSNVLSGDILFSGSADGNNAAGTSFSSSSFCSVSTNIVVTLDEVMAGMLCRNPSDRLTAATSHQRLQALEEAMDRDELKALADSLH